MTTIDFCVWLVFTILFGSALIEPLLKIFKDKEDEK